MHWNYRIVKYSGDDGYGLHEVYYDDDKVADARTENAIVVGDTPEAIIQSLEMMLKDANLCKEDPIEDGTFALKMFKEH